MSRRQGGERKREKKKQDGAYKRKIEGKVIKEMRNRKTDSRGEQGRKER